MTLTRAVSVLFGAEARLIFFFLKIRLLLIKEVSCTNTDFSKIFDKKFNLEMSLKLLETGV